MSLKAQSMLWPGPDMIPRESPDQDPKMNSRPKCENPNVVNIPKLNVRVPDYFYDFENFIP